MKHPRKKVDPLFGFWNRAKACVDCVWPRKEPRGLLVCEFCAPFENRVKKTQRVMERRMLRVGCLCRADNALARPKKHDGSTSDLPAKEHNIRSVLTHYTPPQGRDRLEPVLRRVWCPNGLVVPQISTKYSHATREPLRSLRAAAFQARGKYTEIHSQIRFG